MREDAPFLGCGWAFPPTFRGDGADVDMVSGDTDIAQGLRILLSTRPGERIMREDFGCDLASQLFGELDQGLQNAVERLIEDAILEYEPRIDVERIDVQPREDMPHCVQVELTYVIRGTNSRFNMVFPFYLMEAAHNGL